ncbi:MAG: hypothetical protein WC711_02455 [Candidatus Staskawiczbacteria bacterium]|jgi:hypothetical protein
MNSRPYTKDDDKVLMFWEVAIYECAKKMWPNLTPEQFGEASCALVASHLLDTDFSLPIMLRIIVDELTRRHGKPLSLAEITKQEMSARDQLSARIHCPRRQTGRRRSP